MYCEERGDITAIPAVEVNPLIDPVVSISSFGYESPVLFLGDSTYIR